MILMVFSGLKPLATMALSVSVSTATPDALSSAPGARPVDAFELLIESMCPPSTITSVELLVPAIVTITEGCCQE
jgi:hypothetical protein